jgi:formylglycine-generating enzyme required for sulfatase activity
MQRGAIGMLIFVVVAIGTWLWKEGQQGLTFEQTILRAASKVMSIHIEPEMQTVSAGTFRQGDSRGDSFEQPVREVTMKTFAIGKFEVSFDEYDRFALATNRVPLVNDAGWGRGRRPVINLSWNDARDYAKWLSEKTRKRYRLPTESEWEYAARSGGKEESWAGTSDEKQLAKYAVYEEDRTAPVGEREPNGLELHDMSGNVWEWVEDCWHENYTGAPADGSAWIEARAGGCIQHVIRGGSWINLPRYQRTWVRHATGTRSRDNTVGFRLAQDID